EGQDSAAGAAAWKPATNPSPVLRPRRFVRRVHSPALLFTGAPLLLRDRIENLLGLGGRQPGPGRRVLLWLPRGPTGRIRVLGSASTPWWGLSNGELQIAFRGLIARLEQ